MIFNKMPKLKCITEIEKLEEQNFHILAIARSNDVIYFKISPRKFNGDSDPTKLPN